MSVVAIRPVCAHEAADWQRLRDDLWEGDDHASEIAAFFAGAVEEPVAVLLAWSTDGQALGHVELSIRSDVPGLQGVRTGYIEGLYVLPAQRHAGIARALLNAARRWARAAQCQAFASDRDERVVIDRRYRQLASP